MMIKTRIWVIQDDGHDKDRDKDHHDDDHDGDGRMEVHLLGMEWLRHDDKDQNQDNLG